MLKLHGLGRTNVSSKTLMARQLLDWLERHPAESLELPAGLRRLQRTAQGTMRAPQGQPIHPAARRNAAQTVDSDEAPSEATVDDGDRSVSMRDASPPQGRRRRRNCRGRASAHRGRSTEQPPEPHQATAGTSPSLETHLRTLPRILSDVISTLAGAATLARSVHNGTATPADGARQSQCVAATLQQVHVLASGMAIERLRSAWTTAGVSAGPGVRAGATHVAPGREAGDPSPAVRRSWAGVVRDGAHPAPQSGGPGPLNPLHRRAWSNDRTLVVRPEDEAARTRPTQRQQFGTGIEQVIRSRFPRLTGPILELVGRTNRGDYALQFSPAVWGCIGTASPVPEFRVPGFGTWVPVRQGAPGVSVVLRGVPLGLSDDDIRQALVHGNSATWAPMTTDEVSRGILAVQRMNRKTKAANGQTAWEPSLGIKVTLTAPCASSLLQHGSALVAFKVVEVAPFEPPKRRCFRCGEVGTHLGQYCRNSARCRHCGGAHETRHCSRGSPSAPHRPETGHAHSNARGPQGGAASSP